MLTHDIGGLACMTHTDASYDWVRGKASISKPFCVDAQHFEPTMRVDATSVMSASEDRIIELQRDPYDKSTQQGAAMAAGCIRSSGY